MRSRTFIAEMNFFVKLLNRNISGRESGSNKQTASKSCALSLVRQLYHLGVVEAFQGTIKVKKSDDEMLPYQVKVNPQLVGKIEECLKELQIDLPCKNITIPPQAESVNILVISILNIL